MWILEKLFGSDNFINKGMELIDEAFESAEEKASNKIELIRAYEPYKVAQRYLALIFSFTFVGTYVLVLVMYFYDKDTTEVTNILQSFQIDMIMLTIVMFYFGGGLVNSFKGVRKKEG